MVRCRNISCLLSLLSIGFMLLGCGRPKPPVEPPASPQPLVEVELDEVVATIDHLTYGCNQPLIQEVPFRRIGGNRTTGYNWEINASHAGIDADNMSDRWLNRSVSLDETDSRPAAWMLEKLARHKAENADSLVTVPLVGYVVADGDGTSVASDQTAPSKRWAAVVAAKPGGNFGQPDLNDGKVYVDEEVAWLVANAGTANQGGPKYYSLDNEPSLWSDTHPRLHPEKTTYSEVTSQAIAAADAVLSVDADAKIVGPSLYGWNAHQSLQSAPDKSSLNNEHGNFSAYFLSQMRQASEQKGRRLLHVFDFHWYSEATAGGTRIARGEGDSLTSAEIVRARLQAPRSLWDPTYVEDSWIAASLGEPIQLIPRMQGIIEANYPGTRLGFLEYNYGAGHHISGGLATADALGIFGQHGVAACLWVERSGNDYEKAAFRLFLNYDQAGSHFQNLALKTSSATPQLDSVYASRSDDGKTITVVLINKQAKSSLQKQIQLNGSEQEGTLRAYRFGPGQPQVLPVGEDQLQSVTGGFEIECPPHTATLVEIKL